MTNSLLIQLQLDVMQLDVKCHFCGYNFFNPLGLINTFIAKDRTINKNKSKKSNDTQKNGQNASSSSVKLKSSMLF